MSPFFERCYESLPGRDTGAASCSQRDKSHWICAFCARSELTRTTRSRRFHGILCPGTTHMHMFRTRAKFVPRGGTTAEKKIKPGGLVHFEIPSDMCALCPRRILQVRWSFAHSCVVFHVSLMRKVPGEPLGCSWRATEQAVQHFGGLKRSSESVEGSRLWEIFH